MSEHIAERAAAYCAGDLPDVDHARLDAHLTVCAECRSEVEEVRLALGAVTEWPKNPALPTALEERIVRSLDAAHREGTLRTRRRWWASRVAAALILGTGCGAIGFGAGRLTSSIADRDGSLATTPADSTLRSYLLLLEEPVWPPPQPLARARTGYAAWLAEMAAESRFGGAEKLTEEPGFRVSAAGEAVRLSDSAPNYSGWYIVRARSYAEAIAWTRRGPHLQYGSVLVREIEP